MENDSTYQSYAKDLVNNVNNESLKYLIKLFMNRAAINMSADFTDKTLDGSVYIVLKYFSHIPMYYIASGFVKGSLGDYGPGRLNPRSIKHWLGEISLEYNRYLANKMQDNKTNDVSIAYDLHKYPVGQAIIKKIEWYQDGKINGDDWDNINLQALTDAIAKGAVIRLSDFLDII